ncbi:hypothetical protein ACWDBW_28210 [Streptomyces sp. NPDC001107]
MATGRRQDRNPGAAGELDLPATSPADEARARQLAEAVALRAEHHAAHDRHSAL